MNFEDTLINNNKIKPFKGLMWETALNCTSCRKGYCKIKKYCYAKRDAKRHHQHYHKTVTASNNINKIFENKELLNKFVEYIQINDFKVIRINLVGDFKNAESVCNIIELAERTPNIKYYGYSKRIDLKNELREAAKINNIYLGSNIKKLHKINNFNAYKTETDIKKYYESSNKCGMFCAGCGNCYNLKNNKISCFIHSAPSHIQKIINTKKNKNFLISLLNQKLNLNVSYDDIGGGHFVNSFVELLNNKGVETPSKVVKTVPDLIKFIELEAIKNI